MEFRQFRYILKIAEEGTLSLAAKKLYISQPSLSQLLAAQEKKTAHLSSTAVAHASRRPPSAGSTSRRRAPSSRSMRRSISRWMTACTARRAT